MTYISLKPGVQLTEGKKGRSPLPFFENRKKVPCFCASMGYILILNAVFKSIFEKKHQNFPLRDPLYVLHETFVEVSLFQETSSAPKNSWLRACIKLTLSASGALNEVSELF